MAEEIEYSDRYTALGIQPNGCGGPCEGTGWVPLNEKEKDPILRDLWMKAHDEANHEPLSPEQVTANVIDGSDWHFVVCPVCAGKKASANG
jgi:hypothetical protein